MTDYPEHVKLYEHREQVTTILDFLEALPGLNHEIHYVSTEDGRCFAAIPPHKLIYEWLGIDPVALEAEKRQMVAELRSSNSLP